VHFIGSALGLYADRRSAGQSLLGVELLLTTFTVSMDSSDGT